MSAPKKLLSLVLILIIIGVLGVSVVRAQNERVILQLVVPSFQAEFFPDDVFADFEAAHPGVKVVLVEASSPFFPPSYVDLEAHFSEVSDYVKMGDVLAVNSASFSVEATRAGYFLDMRPLTSADPTLNAADFYPNVWESVQWDNGVWALPVSVDVYTLAYNPERFDQAGVPYPNTSWTISDFVTYIPQLTQTDADGSVLVSGFNGAGTNNLAMLFRALSGEDVVDDGVLPIFPDYSSPNLESLVRSWSSLEGEEIFQISDFSQVPMQLQGSFIYSSAFGSEGAEWQGSLLPGDTAGLSWDGFSISAGTVYPQEAYELAKYMTQKPEVADVMFGFAHARQSLWGENPEGGLPVRGGNPEQMAFLQDALLAAMPTTQTQFMRPVADLALQLVNDVNASDPASALQELEQTIIDNLNTAASRGEESVIAVSTPVPTPVLGAGEIALNFGMQSFVNPLPNLDEWETLQDRFIANDPEVANIVLDTTLQGDLATYSEDYDCFTLPYNAVPGADLSPLLNLDPFMDADPNFDRIDVVGNTLAQLQQDNKTWALPLNLQPQALEYDSQVFQQQGVMDPQLGWTVDQFWDAVHQLAPATDGDPVFYTRSPSGNYILLLLAAFGGLPIDYRTNPPALNFTDPAVLEAAQQVLNLAKDGLLDYQPLTDLRGFVGGGGGSADVTPIIDFTLNAFVFVVGGGRGFDDQEDPYRVTTYPLGNEYVGLSYEIGTGYISANTPHPEACYRWLSAIANEVVLFNSMPARHSLISSPELAGLEQPDVVAFYNYYDTLLQAPNAVVFPGGFVGPVSIQRFLTTRWLFEVFDRYVLEDLPVTDLEAELADAEMTTQAFLDCADRIVPYDSSTYADQFSYLQEYLSCAESVDPSLGDLF